MDYIEIEYKYSANGIKLCEFEQVCENIKEFESNKIELTPVGKASFWDSNLFSGTLSTNKIFNTFNEEPPTRAISTDVFYKLLTTATLKVPDVVRYRFNKSGSRQELTLKKKTIQDNCVNRVEINLNLRSNRSTVNAFMELLGYAYDYEIEKKFTIYHYKNCEIVYYTVIPLASSKRNSFIEIEATKYKTEQEALDIINYYEKLLANEFEILGISLASRINESLYTLCKPIDI